MTLMFDESSLPAYKREAIHWLDGYENTARLIELIRYSCIPPAELAAWRRDFEKWLTPKQSKAADARSIRAGGS